MREMKPLAHFLWSSTTWIAACLALLAAPHPAASEEVPIEEVVGATSEPPIPEIERLVPFDTAERLLVITPPLVSRLHLQAPEWPVEGAMVEARLFESAFDSQSGTLSSPQAARHHVLVVEREDRLFERLNLSAEQVAALRAAVERGLAGIGSIASTDRLVAAGEEAGGRFVRGQSILGALVYGPAMAALPENSNAPASTALYLATAGATMFTALTVSKSNSISPPQAHLSTDAGWKGGASGFALAVAGDLSGDLDGGTLGAATLAGGIVGSVCGYKWGKWMTDAEAHGASFGSSFLGAATLGAVTYAGTFDDDESDSEARLGIASVAAGLIAGYPLGSHYARRASYAITGGDVGALTAAAGIGVLAAGAFLADDDDESTRVSAGALTAGLILGTIGGDLSLVRPYDHTEGEGWLVGIGSLAGGLLAAAIPASQRDSGETDDQATLVAGALGSIVGLAVTELILSPKPGRRRAKP